MSAIALSADSSLDLQMKRARTRNIKKAGCLANRSLQEVRKKEFPFHTFLPLIYYCSINNQFSVYLILFRYQLTGTA